MVPKELRCGLEVPKVPRVGVEVVKKSDRGPQGSGGGTQEEGWRCSRFLMVGGGPQGAHGSARDKQEEQPRSQGP